MPPKNEQLRVLIVRLGAMGDILHALPAVASLRKAHPHWFFGWVVEPRWLALLRSPNGDMPLVDRVHLASAREWSRAPFAAETLGGIRALRKELRDGRYDISVDLQGAVRSALIARLATTPRVLGEERPREPLARWLFRERASTRGDHVIEQALDVCEKIAGDKLIAVRPPLPVDPESEAWAERLLSTVTHGTSGTATEPKGTILISPGAGWGAKRWPADRYGAVALNLNQAGYRVLINAGPEEREIAMQAIESSGGVAQAPEFTVPRLIAATRRVSLTIGGDTGPLHLACALGKPVVGVYGPTEPKRNGPFGVPFRVLRHPESKRDHTRYAQPEAGLLTITVDQVFEAAMELLTRETSADGE